jgi:hypothetical protein
MLNVLPHFTIFTRHQRHQRQQNEEARADDWMLGEVVSSNLNEWLLLAHARARRCGGHDNDAGTLNSEVKKTIKERAVAGRKSLPAPVVDQFNVGAIVRFTEGLPEFWAKGTAA